MFDRKRLFIVSFEKINNERIEINTMTLVIASSPDEAKQIGNGNYVKEISMSKSQTLNLVCDDDHL